MKFGRLFIYAIIFQLSLLNVFAQDSFGVEVFKEYCWGCHHQSAQAFGPSFRQIANSRTKDKIIAQIIDPKDSYKSLGYRINSMPAFDDLNHKQLDAIVNYILKFKDKK